MKKQKQTFITGVFMTLIAILCVAYYQVLKTPQDTSSTELPPSVIEGVGDASMEGTPAIDDSVSGIEARVGAPVGGSDVVAGKLKAATFTGTLEQVDTGCFADGECFVVVGGKHVTAIMGWSQEVVGSLEGVDGFGDFVSHIGKNVEVYAQDAGDGTYTLYGSQGFYIKLLP
jgi:hypothetical protein